MNGEKVEGEEPSSHFAGDGEGGGSGAWGRRKAFVFWKAKMAGELIDLSRAVRQTNRNF